MNDAKSAFAYIIQEKESSVIPSVQVAYIYEEQKDALLSSIHESVDSDKSDPEAANDQEEVKEESKIPQDTRYLTPFKPRQRTNQLPSQHIGLNMTVCVEREDQ